MTVCRARRHALLLFPVLLAAASPVLAQDAAQFFRQQCASCHTVGGGRLTGPDLKDATRRADRAWIARFIGSPQAVIDSGDPYARKLLEEARGVVMPAVPGLTPDLVQALIDLIEAESALPKSQFAGVRLSDRPFTPADVERGRLLFRGDARLASGGAPCMSCHAVRDSGGLGGGRLAPDLTRVYERLQGPAALAAWLNSPPTPTMRALFPAGALQEPEILPLVAYFEDAARKGGDDNRSGALAFVLIGLAGAALGLVLMDTAWRRRLRGVRRALVSRSRSGRN